MRQSSYKVGTEQKIIEAIANGIEWSVNVKIAKSGVTAALKEGVLLTGTRITSTGTVATGSDVYGVLINDVDFNNSSGTEIGAVCIHGCLSKELIKKHCGTEVSAEEVAALKLIKFL